MPKATVCDPGATPSCFPGSLKVASLLLTIATLGASPALAQQVYKCSDGKSAAVYQQVPCASPSQEQAVREYAREPGPPAAEPAARESFDGLPARAIPTSKRERPAQTLSPAQRKFKEEMKAIRTPTQCDEARKDLDKANASIGRSVSRIRTAEAFVARACKR